jgi:hypothetical protein
MKERIGNVFQHISTKIHIQALAKFKIDTEKEEFSLKDIKNANYIVDFILQAGLPFSTVENPNLRKITSFLPCRQTLSKRPPRLQKKLQIELEST